MTEDPSPQTPEECTCDEVRCHRLERDLPVDEHYQCAYCLGSKEEIESGEHKKFCDFQKGKDPIHFGFPEDTSRHERG